MKILPWVRNQLAALAISLSSVEKNLLGQNKKQLEDEIKNEQNNVHNNLADALLKGVLTEEVKKLRWRNYKIFKASKGAKIKKGAVLHERNSVVKINHQHELGKIKLDPFDTYNLELVVNNKDVVLSTINVLENEKIDSDGEIKSDDYFATLKAEKPIKINRSFTSKFSIEDFAVKMHVRSINETEKLLEFYVSKYADEKRIASGLFINNVKKSIDNISYRKFLSIEEVGFVSDNTLGTDDLLVYSYKVKSLDKIVEYDGYYIVKYTADVIVDGYDITNEFINDELENKYEKNAPKY